MEVGRTNKRGGEGGKDRVREREFRRGRVRVPLSCYTLLSSPHLAVERQSISGEKGKRSARLRSPLSPPAAALFLAFEGERGEEGNVASCEEAVTHELAHTFFLLKKNFFLTSKGSLFLSPSSPSFPPSFPPFIPVVSARPWALS